MEEEEIDEVWRAYNIAHGYNFHEPDPKTEPIELPKPVVEVISQPVWASA